MEVKHKQESADSVAWSQLNRNQKKKRRNKLARQGKRLAALIEAPAKAAGQAVGEREGLRAGSTDMAPATPAQSQQSTPQSLALPAADTECTSSNAELQARATLAQATSSCRVDLSSAALLLGTVPASLPSQGATAADQPPPSKRGRLTFVNGNYNRYYGYRLGAGQQEDPRIQALDKRCFVNKRCLDIGCNEGVISVTLSARYGCKSMLGIDIDENLIKRACMVLRAERTKASEERDALLHGPLNGSGSGVGLDKQRKDAAARVKGLAHVWFQQGDIVTSDLEAGSMDTVTCLSVTKWVHLHTGDEGLRALFRKVHDVLAPGGYFILEPQPWKSYRQAVHVKLRASGAVHVPLDSLALRPEDFPTYLTSQLGFKLIETIRVPSSTAGFDRPIFWFKKL